MATEIKYFKTIEDYGTNDTKKLLVLEDDGMSTECKFFKILRGGKRVMLEKIFKRVFNLLCHEVALFER